MYNKIKRALSNPKIIKRYILKNFLSPFLPDKTYLKALFRVEMGYKLDLENPKTFSEKLQWLKLYDRKPEYTIMVDKYAAKDYVAKQIGKEYIIPTLGVWDRAEDIEWDKLPKRFVLKTTHDSGTAIIVKDKDTLDKRKAKKRLNKSLRRDFYKCYREWPYKNVPRRIIAEEFLEQKIETKHKDLPDYKIFCFNGKAKYCQVISDRNEEMCIDFFDREWKHQPFHEPRNYPFAPVEPQKPKYLEQMFACAEELAKKEDFVRVDFYEVNDNVYFGEITFFPTAGFGGFDPKDYDAILGKMLVLTGKTVWGGVRITFTDTYKIEEVDKVSKDLIDYKIFCFNGEPKYCQVIKDRHTEETIDFYDTQWNHQEFIGLNPVAKHSSTPVAKHSSTPVAKPVHYEQMLRIAKELAKDNPFTRVDLYEVNKDVFFGEITLFPMAGLGEFTPEQYNEILGKMLVLTGKTSMGGVRITFTDTYKIETITENIRDYKFFCFDGKVKSILIVSDRAKGEARMDYYDENFNHLPFVQGGKNYEGYIAQPENLAQMIEVAERLAKNIPHVRIDLYDIDGHIYFGEYTFFDSAGLEPFEPEEWNYTFGSWIKLG